MLSNAIFNRKSERSVPTDAIIDVNKLWYVKATDGYEYHFNSFQKQSNGFFDLSKRFLHMQTEFIFFHQIRMSIITSIIAMHPHLMVRWYRVVMVWEWPCASRINQSENYGLMDLLRVIVPFYCNGILASVWRN